MVWPPPKVLKSPEGEVTLERPHAGAPDESSVVTGVLPEARLADAVLPDARLPDGRLSDAGAPEAARPPPALPGATVSVMAATAVPRDWLERPESLIGCVLGSRYRVVSVIGRGPMGIACEGESSRGRQVTLKLLPRAPALPVEHFAWQLRQALALAHFDHPNVTPISDFGPLEDGGAFVSRSRVPGVSLRTMLRQGALPLARSLDIARQIASALASAHSQEIAHGRLKPENIIVQGGARAGDLIKVVDFGMAGLPINLSAVAPNEHEARRLALRTRLYLPADVTGASPAIDVYSLGVILFEMIAGQPPFVFETPPPPGAEPTPLSFAQCDPSLVVPASVNELVFALLHTRALEHGLSAARVGEMLDGLLGRPGVAPAPEPVTAQVASAPAPHPAPDPGAARLAGPDVLSFAAPSASMVWPASPAPAPSRSHSFPPLPQGFVSTVPPAPVELAAPPSEPPPSIVPLAVHPSVDARESTRSVPPPPPSRRNSAAYPPPSSARRPPSAIDEPFATPSFPPPNISIPQAPPTPNISVVQGPSPLPPAPSGVDDMDEMELRPSFIGRLKRLFGKKPPSEF
jgi:serine/threonine protein kinase